MSSPIRVCFVCLGNICRSPTAEAVFTHLVEQEGLAHRFEIDSAGTGGWHVGERAHRDTRAAARERGVEVTSIARQFQRADFDRFDFVIAMDRSNRDNLVRLAAGGPYDVHLFRDFDPASPKGSEVPDPYYEGGFDRVFDICEAAARGFLAHLRESHDL
ncbi:MAG: low molecular weight phosphotyrosine protein phosphatase [Myxococcales bacterium]|nr:low molecular weight phosphotyrosine protein phosphatase [Myxococcales bacterium]